jgi:hypothetical protein
LDKKKPEPKFRQFIFPLVREERMAGAMGLEPTTSGVTGQRCNQLYYAPAMKHQITESILFGKQQTREF